ncbi:MAG: hypothetical protein V2A79_02915 [Planctomycetota bacterium]
MNESALLRRYRRLAWQDPALGISQMLGSAEGKIGPSKTTRVFNLPMLVTCYAADENGATIASAACRPLCYGWALLRKFRGGVGKRADRNFRLLSRPDWPDLMIAAIRVNDVKALRLHSTGDFFAEAYILGWRYIALACPDVAFWGYTRAWSRLCLVPALAKLAALPNVRLLLSFDRTMPEPPHIPNTGLAYMSVHGEDVPPCPVGVVFRASLERTVQRVMGNPPSIVCPHENGAAEDAPVCVECGRCLPAARLPVVAAG